MIHYESRLEYFAFETSARKILLTLKYRSDKKFLYYFSPEAPVIMNKLSQKLEVTANVLIIVVALVLGVALIKRFFIDPTAVNAPERKAPAVGQKVADTGIDLAASPKNVLLVLQKGCKYCTESAAFYKNLIEQTKDKNVKVIAVLPQSKDEAEQYVKDLGISGIEIRQSQLDSLNVGGTPTIIVTDNQGVISDTWIGKLTPDKESEVIKKLTM